VDKCFTVVGHRKTAPGPRGVIEHFSIRLLGWVPDAHDAVGPRRGQHSAVSREGYVPASAAVAREYVSQSGAGQVPHVNISLIVDNGQQTIVGREGNRFHARSVSLEGEKGFAGRGVHEVHAWGPAGHGHCCTLVRKGQSTRL
jgi:hypothetical protein